MEVPRKRLQMHWICLHKQRFACRDMPNSWRRGILKFDRSITIWWNNEIELNGSPSSTNILFLFVWFDRNMPTSLSELSSTLPTIPPNKLPRLAFISDVPVEATCHGSALVFRLLQEYPSEQLRVVETNILSSSPEKRLPAVSYTHLTLPTKRIV